MRFLIFCTAAVFFSCQKPRIGGTHIPMEKSYLALGDSYTVGEAVTQEESFPFQLAAQLNAGGLETAEPEVLAFTGWTTRNLIDAIEQVELKEKYDFVTVLIGVNNQYVNGSEETYRQEFNDILNTAISHSAGGRATVFVLSIPDWGVTPYGKLKQSRDIASEINRFNAINKKASLDASVHYIDITPVSRLADKDPTMTSIDSLHPSGKMYSEWVKLLLPLVRKELF